MRLTSIAAMDRDRVIGSDGRLPWRLPDDFRWFVRHTLGKPVVMGRRTFESIGRPLPDRLNIVLSRDAAYRPEGCVVARSEAAALSAAGDVPEVMIGGGAVVYDRLLPHLHRQILTFVDARVEGDSRYPEWNPGEWREVERTEHPADARHAHAFTWVILERRGAPEPLPPEQDASRRLPEDPSGPP